MNWYNPLRIKEMSDKDQKTAMLYAGIGLLLGIIIGGR